jgi:hypothetical protein
MKRSLLIMSFCISFFSTNMYSSESQNTKKTQSKFDYRWLAKKIDKFGVNKQLPMQLEELATGLVICKKCEEIRKKTAAQNFCVKAK